MRCFLIVVILLLVQGCGGKVDYIRPTTQLSTATNVKTIEKPQEIVWNASVPEIGKRFFVINNLDKSSGFMNISYTGDVQNAT